MKRNLTSEEFFEPLSEEFFEPLSGCTIGFHHIIIFVTILIICCLLSACIGWECCKRQERESSVVTTYDQSLINENGVFDNTGKVIQILTEGAVEQFKADNAWLFPMKHYQSGGYIHIPQMQHAVADTDYPVRTDKKVLAEIKELQRKVKELEQQLPALKGEVAAQRKRLESVGIISEKPEKFKWRIIPL